MTANDSPVIPARILIVDDERPQRITLRRALEREGYDVLDVTNGEECLAIAYHYQTSSLTDSSFPSIILLDAIMPQMDGFTCCSQLHQLLGDQCPAILMITALNDRESIDRAFEAGATDYIHKPIQWAVLRHRVRRLLQMKWAQDTQDRLMAELRATMEHERFLKKQLELANQKLEQLATLDGLTHLANRRCFDESLQREWRRLMRERNPLSLILCDIDYFKRYNDTYGHLAGDECLKQVADLLRNVTKRPADLVARYGGEEFVILLPNTDIAGAIQIAEMAQDHLKQAAIAHTASFVKPYITLSIGIAGMIPSLNTQPTMLIAWADEALYLAKSQGRNQYCIH